MNTEKMFQQAVDVLNGLKQGYAQLYLTGAQWNKLYELETGQTILDPDGWNREIDEYSTLFITHAEFERRMVHSTVVPLIQDKPFSTRVVLGKPIKYQPSPEELSCE